MNWDVKEIAHINHKFNGRRSKGLARFELKN